MDGFSLESGGLVGASVGSMVGVLVMVGRLAIIEDIVLGCLVGELVTVREGLSDVGLMFLLRLVGEGDIIIEIGALLVGSRVGVTSKLAVGRFDGGFDTGGLVGGFAGAIVTRKREVGLLVGDFDMGCLVGGLVGRFVTRKPAVGL